MYVFSLVQHCKNLVFVKCAIQINWIGLDNSWNACHTEGITQFEHLSRNCFRLHWICEFGQLPEQVQAEYTPLSCSGVPWPNRFFTLRASISQYSRQPTEKQCGLPSYHRNKACVYFPPTVCCWHCPKSQLTIRKYFHWFSTFLELWTTNIFWTIRTDHDTQPPYTYILKKYLSI